MISYLDRFSKRMELIAEIASVIRRTNTNREIESRFSDNELDNIIIAVLVHIMERSLTEGSKCTLDDIEDFLAAVLTDYHYEFSDDELRELTRYIVKDILQNKGENFKFRIMDHNEGVMKTTSVRLIKDIADDDNTISYVLENQGFDMLFRTKEVDEELGFQLEEIRLQKLIENGNYSDASDQSKTLLNMLNQKEIELELFERRMKNDLNNTSGEEYETIIGSIEQMLSDEYKVMNEIKKTVSKAEKSFEKRSAITDSLKTELEEKRTALFIIERNVERILARQRKLLSHSRDIGQLYKESLVKMMTSHRIRCYDIEDVILKQLEEYGTDSKNDIGEVCARLLGPLMLPKLPDILDIGLFYQPQDMREEVEGEESEAEELIDDGSEYRKEIERKNAANTEIVKILLRFASENSIGFRLTDLWEYCLESIAPSVLAEGRRFFLIMLKLFEFTVIDIPKWRGESNKTEDSQGEFDLSYSLGRISENEPKMYGIKRIIIENTGELSVLECTYTDSATGLKVRESVKTDNMRFIVEADNNA